jgi:hypothetical protein
MLPMPSIPEARNVARETGKAIIILPVRHDDDSAFSWPDQAQVRRWDAVLERIALREVVERGIEERASVVFEFGVLTARYGSYRHAVSGSEAVQDEDALFRAIDYWIAFERNGGVDADELLDRDRAVIDRWMERLPRDQQDWQECADLVCRDINRTSPLNWIPRVTIHDDEEVWPRPDFGPSPQPSVAAWGVGMWIVGAANESRRRALLLPELWISIDRYELRLPSDLVGHEWRVGFLANQLQEWMIEEIWGAWPECPDHSHPLEPQGSVWVCPTTERVLASVGDLPATENRELG